MKRRERLSWAVVALVLVICGAPPALAQVAWEGQAYCVWPGSPGSWDEGGHRLGDVVFDGSVYHMYLTGGTDMIPFATPWSVGHWTSIDRVIWTPDPANPVLEPGVSGSWDDHSIIDASVIYDGMSFHMWYGAGRAGEPTWVGYATSADGSDWTKYEFNPLTGLGPGPPGAWDELGTAPSTVLDDGGNYHMWYTGMNTGGLWQIGYASSPDGLAWTKHPDQVLWPSEAWEGESVYRPEVVDYGSGFAMWYTGFRTDTAPNPLAAIGYAVSTDGINWGRWNQNPVFSPGWPPCNILDSSAVIIEGETVHGWFSECADIGYATSPAEIVFFDQFETGDTSVWTTTAP
jgi:predicted GH43/DUF377 family glycosyl hydrolase